jgi:hypothetical protein
MLWDYSTVHPVSALRTSDGGRMKIEFRCTCGKSFATKAENAGRKAKCNACGAELTIPDQPPVELEEVADISPADMSLEVNLGNVSDSSNRMSFSFKVHGSGAAHVRIYTYDTTNLRKTGIFVTLDQEGYEQLKAIVAKTDSTIQRLQSAGRIQDRLEVRWD